MEATTTNKLTWEWMEIRLACSQTEAQVTFSITFVNSSDALRELPFSNRARKAEYWGLQIEETNNHKVVPERTHIITPRVPDPDIHPLMSGESWSYELVGEITTAGLEFPASLFRLREGEQYEARFQYKGVTSNQVSLCL